MGSKGKEHYTCDLNHRAANELILTPLLRQLHHGDNFALIVPVKHWVAMRNVKEMEIASYD